MGYHTDLVGEFTLDKPLSKEHREYLKQFAETRRMKRDSILTDKRPDPIRKAAGLAVGIQGGFFVGEGGMAGQDSGKDILDYNHPPVGQPGLWCQWEPTEDGTAIVWNSGEKFYRYTEWLIYLIEHFIKPWGYSLTGRVDWQGEDSDDIGVIWVRKNVVKAVKSTIVAEEPDWGDEDGGASVAEPDIAPNPIEDVIADAMMGDD